MSERTEGTARRVRSEASTRMNVDDLATELATARALSTVHDGEGIGLESVALGPGALDSLAARVATVMHPGRPIVVFEDAVPMTIDGQELKPLAEALLAEVGPVRRVVLGRPDGTLHADAATIAVAAGAADGAGCVVTVGSGTLTDIGKEAARASGVPLVAVQTAASVNGYADGLAVVLRDGVKRTVPSVWPRALVVDTRILRDAPLVLTRSGFAEMMASFSAPADWRLADAFGYDRFDPAVVRLFRDRGEDLLRSAAGLDTGDEQALRLLAALLTTSGVAMGITGGTAPLSGTEHLVSHLLDMAALAEGRPVGLHGAQVGVASVVAACVWEHLLARLDPSHLSATSDAGDASGLADLGPPALEDDDVRRRVDDAFTRLDPSGAMAAECWSDYHHKLAAWHSGTHHRAAARAAWPTLEPELRTLVGDAAALAKALTEAGAPTRFSDLDPPVAESTARWAVTSCHLMRRRFTVIDLAFFTGYWSEADVDAVLDRAASVGGGL